MNKQNVNAAIILSGGTGTRLGTDIPKQYIEVSGKSILEYSLNPFVLSNHIDIIVIVVSPKWLEHVKSLIKKNIHTHKQTLFAVSGETRQLSILNGLNVLDEQTFQTDKVIIHDAARPLVTKTLIEECLHSISDKYEGVMPVIAVKDTIYSSKDGYNIDGLLDRNRLYAGQAPEAFKFKPYINAHLKLTKNELLSINGSSELAFLNGMKIKMIPGDSQNFKITDSSDMDRFKKIVR